MANRIRAVDEKIEPIRIALKQINVAEAARQAEIPESTLRYDLNKLEQALKQGNRKVYDVELPHLQTKGLLQKSRGGAPTGSTGHTGRHIPPS